MFRVAIITKLGTAYSLNAETRQEIDDFLLSIDEKEGLKIYRIIIKETNEVIETQDGVKNKGDNQ
jgi:RNase P/RNase MRP subunit p30